MGDLIWIGNTLLPRWFVAVMLLLGLLVLSIIWSWMYRGRSGL